MKNCIDFCNDSNFIAENICSACSCSSGFPCLIPLEWKKFVFNNSDITHLAKAVNNKYQYYYLTETVKMYFPELSYKLEIILLLK